MRDVGAGRDGLNILLYQDRDHALERAAACDALRPARQPMPLLGVPVVIKDNIATSVMPTSCGSKILEGYVSPYEATAVERLRDAGAIVVAKSNMDEFAMGSSTENSAFGPAKNPLAPDRVPGGSSGGSAAAVAAGIARIALGSETGGSVRQPAAFCGVVGVKPTYGRVSRYGLVAFASSLDHIGVFGRTVDDAALGLEVIAGVDPLDSTSAAEPVPTFRDAARGGLTGVVIGRPKEYFPDDLDPRIRDRCDAALDHMRALGAEVRDVSLPHTKLAIEVYYIIAPAEASSNLARFDGVRYGLRIEGDGLGAMYEATRSRGFGAEVTRRILLGTYVLSAGYYDAYYRKAQQVRALIARDFAERVRERRPSAVHADDADARVSARLEVRSVRDVSERHLHLHGESRRRAGDVACRSVASTGFPSADSSSPVTSTSAQMFVAAYALERALGAEAHR